MTPERSTRSLQEETCASGTDIKTPLRNSSRRSATSRHSPPPSDIWDSPQATPQRARKIPTLDDASHTFVTFANPLFGKRCDWEDENVATPVVKKKSWMLVGGRRSPRLAASRVKRADDSKRKFLALTKALEGRRASESLQESQHTKRRRLSSVV